MPLGSDNLALIITTKFLERSVCSNRIKLIPFIPAIAIEVFGEFGEKIQIKMDEEKRAPGEFMRQLFGKRVQIKLTNSQKFVGKLVSLDGAMNLVLEQADEFQAGSKPKDPPSHFYDSIFLRGNNGE